MNKFSKLEIIILFFTIYFLFSSQANAASLNLSSPLSEIGINQEFQIDLMLDAEGQDINAVEGKISFPEALLKLKEIQDGDSIINFWIERPEIKQVNAIIFSGIIPGGYQGKGFLFSAVLETKESGNGAIKINDVKILRNDGKGAKARVQISDFQFQIVETEFPIGNSVSKQILKDTEPPELFAPEIASDPDIFNGKWFLVFATQDKGSGMDHYKVCEKIKTKCVIAESPYVLQNQNLNRKIFVKAFDKNGNERIVALPAKFAPWYQKPIVDIIGGFIALVVLLLVVRWLWRKIKSQK